MSENNKGGAATPRPRSERRDSTQRDVSYSEMTFVQKVKVKSKFGKVLIALAVVFFITTIIFAALFASYYIKYKKSAPVTTTAAEKVCSTRECVLAASTIARKMKMDANPCADFNLYACGTFIEETVYPEGATDVGTFDVLQHENNLKMKDIITEDNVYDHLSFMKNMKRLYKSCMDEVKIEEQDLKDIFKDEHQFKANWPVFNSGQWSKQLNELVEYYTDQQLLPFFSIRVEPDWENSKRKVIYLDEPEFGLTQETFKRNDNIQREAYKNFLVNFAVALGVNESIARRDVHYVEDLEFQLSGKRVSQADKRDKKKDKPRMTLGSMPYKKDTINIPDVIRQYFKKAGVELSNDQEIIPVSEKYITDMLEFIRTYTQSSGNRTIANLMGFKFALSRVGGLTRRLRDIQLELDKVITGRKAQSPRWEYCLRTSAGYFDKAMGLMFVNKTSPAPVIKAVDLMVGNVQDEFKEMIKANIWISNTTKEEAYRKLAAITRKIGYPDTKFGANNIEEEYREYNMSENRFYDNLVLLRKLSIKRYLTGLREDVDKKKWHMAAYAVNSYYSSSRNDIVFPAGILRPPFFSHAFPESLNYGALGSVIGHAIIYGFNDEGSQFDEQGNLKDWWQTTDKEMFKKQVKCIADQNSKIRVDEINENLNGINTQSHAVADSDGLKLSYRTYKRLMSKRREPQMMLPGLNLTHDQLFFLAYSQMWCDRMTNETLKLQVTSDSRLPPKYRILQTLRNSEDFAQAFKCSPRTSMNRPEKCHIW